MRKLSLSFFAIIIGLSTNAQSEFKKSVSQISTDIANKLVVKGKKKIVVLFVTDINKAPSVAGKFIADFVSVEIVNHDGNFQVFDRENLNSIVEAKKLMAEGYIDVERTMQLGKLLSVEAIVVGNYTVLSNTLSLTLKGLDVNNGFVIAAAMKDLPLDNDAGALLGINVGSTTPGNNSGANSDNRGFNKPISSNDNYNNPGTVNKECEQNNTGDYCFKNGSSARIQIYVEARGIGCSSYSTIVLAEGETKCLYELKKCVYKYSVTKEEKNFNGEMYFPWGNNNAGGQISVEQCKSKTLDIR